MPERSHDSSSVSEKERLRFLQQSGLLDPSPEEPFDRLTKLARRTLDVPAAQITLIGSDQVLFKSSAPGVEVSSLERKQSCVGRILSMPDDLLIIENSETDDRVDPAEVSLGGDTFRSFMGVPIEVDRYRVGAFCLRDREQRSFSDSEVKNLRLFATQAEELFHSSLPEMETDGRRRNCDQEDHTQRKLLESQKTFKDLIEQAPVAFILTDKNLDIIQVNEKACEQLGYDRPELLQLSIPDVNPSFDTKNEIYDLISDMEPGEIRKFESTHVSKNGRTFPVSARIRKTRAGTRGLLMSWIRDITETKEREKELRQTRNRLQKIIDMAPVAITGLKPNDEVEVWNPAAEELFGWSRDEIIGRKLSEIDGYMPESLKEDHEKLRNESMSGDTVLNYETRRRTKDGEELHILLSTSTVRDQHGEPEIILGIIKDITDLKEAQEELQRALNEKATLLREVHHRVKNNMQMIISMINLHESSDKDRAEDLMQQCRDRIKTMAMIHEMLYQSNDLARLPFDEYVEDLVATILSLNEYSGAMIDVTIDVESSLRLPLSQAVPCGLIIHELVSNACKHGFDDESQNKLIIKMKDRGDCLSLRVMDNGPGFPGEYDPGEIESVGFEIIRSLGEYELGGTLEISSEPLTTVELTFELDDVTL